MFTGIIEEVGEIIRVEQRGDAARLTVRGPITAQGARHGDSIAVSGVCLTVIALHNNPRETAQQSAAAPDTTVPAAPSATAPASDATAPDADKLGTSDQLSVPATANSTTTAFSADVMRETLSVTTLGTVAPGRAVNLERAARVGDRLGGHIVQGHVDAVANLISRREGDAWRVLRFSLPTALAPLVVRKGSIAIDGTSLTISAVSAVSAAVSEPHDSAWFEVSLIPETLSATTLGALEPGDRVNIESDMLARHIERLMHFNNPNNSTKEAL